MSMYLPKILTNCRGVQGSIAIFLAMCQSLRSDSICLCRAYDINLKAIPFLIKSCFYRKLFVLQKF